jgi:hypothetical protein
MRSAETAKWEVKMQEYAATRNGSALKGVSRCSSELGSG